MTSFIAGLMLMAASVVPVFPYTTYEQIPNVTPVSTVCDGRVSMMHAQGYVIYSTDQKDIFLHIGKDGEYDFAYFVIGSGNPIRVHHALTIEQARQRYPGGPCAFFTEADA